MDLSPNEQIVLDRLIAHGSPVGPDELAPACRLGPGMAGAALRSLAQKGLAEELKTRSGFRKQPTGTFAPTAEGHARAAASTGS